MRSLGTLKINLVSLVFVIGLVVGDSSNALADFTFGPPINLGPSINTPYSDGLVCIAPDNLSLYFISNRPGGSGAHDLYVATRASKQDEWSQPVNLGPTVNSSAEEFFSCISSDGLELYFDSTRSGGRGARDLWRTTRQSLDAPWRSPVNLGSLINSASDDVSPNLSADGLTLIFSSSRGGGRGSYDLYICTRTSLNASWSAPVNLGAPVNSAHLDVAPSLSSDDLILFFHSIRPTGFGSYDLYYSRRRARDTPWSAPVHLGPAVNSSYVELGPSLSADGRMLYFCEHPDYTPRPEGFGSTDLWQVSIEPVVDLNGDGMVDSTDVCIMIDNWGTDAPLCDIGPMPWGDGIVDIEDLKVLAEHLFGDMQCVAHFKLDEAKGSIANDSARNHDGVVHGAPEWHPTGGIDGGALELDGVDDYVKTGFLLDPSDRALSVFAWGKGGAPGQVILSQTGAANWLRIDSIEGCLMTELRPTGRAGVPLLSQTCITDGDWHRIGFVWDGSYRYLYVDGVEITKDAAPLSALEGAYGGLFLGVGSDLAVDTFFSGLIDDVRIYNRAVSP